MVDQGPPGSDDAAAGSDRVEPAETESVEVCDVSGATQCVHEGAGGAGGYHDPGETETGGTPRKRAESLEALARASELFAGISGPFGENIRTFVAELPRWFRHPRETEARVRVGERAYETGSFRPNAGSLSAETHTHTGTSVSVTVACAGQRPDPDQHAWLGTERELVERLVSLLKDAVERWEVDSLERVSDGIVALDSDFRYTYVDPRAERILERDGDELYGEHIWEAYPAATDTVFQTELERAVETGSPTSIDQYYMQAGKWVEARIHPSGDGVVIAFTDVTDSKEVEREAERILETVPVGIVLLDAGGHITRANTRAESLLGLSKEEMNGLGYDDPDWDMWDESGDPIPRENHPVTQVLTTGEPVQGFTHGITLPDGTDRWLSSNAAPIEGGDGTTDRVAVALEDITAVKRIERLTEALQVVNETLNGATERRETERAVCELLTDTPEYQYAKIERHTPGTDSSAEDRPRNVSCDDGVGVPRRTRAETDPMRVAVETGEVQVVTSGGTDGWFGSWREFTLDRGFEGGAVVPLGHRNRVRGLLVLYTDRPEAFGDREQTLLKTLGDRVGQVVHSLRTERVIHADELVELTFRSTDPGSVFVHASETLGSSIDIRDTIPTSEETLVHYVSVEDASLAAFREVVEDAARDVRTRQIRDTEISPGGAVEVELERRSLAHTLVANGALVTADTVTDGRAEVVCEVPLGHDVDALVTRLTESFPETTLVAKRNYDRAPHSGHLVGRALDDAFHEELTDRQQQALRAAVYGGYFESPRRSTGTEIAEALSITQPTFAYHLRNAQRTLFGRLIDRLQRR